MKNKIKLGVIGVSEGNGHPYSFSAIINGYNAAEIEKAGWSIISSYLKEKDESEFLSDLATITHVWTQDNEESKKIAKATNIENICDNLEDMIDYVDGVIIARDDYENHYAMAKPFLDSGKKVFVDKPLSLDCDELNYFKKYLENGQLMSCSGIRYARELDKLRSNIDSFGEIKLIKCTVLNSWEKYGIHMLDGVFNIIPFDVEKIIAINSNHISVNLIRKNGSLIQIDALGKASKTFQFDFWSERERFTAEIGDNFTCFKRTLYHFIKMCQTNKTDIPVELTLSLMNALISAKESLNIKKEICI